MALHVKQGTFQSPTQSGSRIQVIDGLGFQPKAIIFYSVGNASLNSHQTNIKNVVGFTTGPNEQMFSAGNMAGHYISQKQFSTSHILSVNSNWGRTQDATLTSFDSDGFTLHWVLSHNGQAGYIGYFALGGEDVINAKALDAGTPTAGGDYVVGDVGFHPNTVLFTVGHSRTTDGIAYNFGVATPTGQWTQSAGSQSTAGFPSSGSWLEHGKVIRNQIESFLVRGAGELTSFNEDGYTLSFNQGMSEDATILSLALELAEPAHVGSIIQPSTPSTSSYSTEGTAKGILTATRSRPASQTRTTDATFGLGLGDGESGYTASSRRNSNNNTFGSRQSLSPILIYDKNGFTSAPPDGQADVDFSDSGFNVNWTLADGQPREVAYLAFVEGLPLVDVSVLLEVSSNVEVTANGIFDTNVQADFETALIPKPTALRLDRLSMFSSSRAEIEPSATYDTQTSVPLSSDIDLFIKRTADDSVSLETFSDIELSPTRVQHISTRLLSQFETLVTSHRVKTNQSSLMSLSDMSISPNMVAYELVDFQTLIEVEAVMNVIGVLTAELESQSSIFVRLSPRQVRTYEKVTSTAFMNIATARQVSLPHGTQIRNKPKGEFQ